ncbi:hypothetical protein L9F63_005221, partial [Diploptera punctata]
DKRGRLHNEVRNAYASASFYSITGADCWGALIYHTCSINISRVFCIALNSNVEACEFKYFILNCVRTAGGVT